MRSHRQNFRRGQAVYTCGMCGRKTRGDGDSNSAELCGQCWELAGEDNHFNDYEEKPDAEQLKYFEMLLGEISDKGGDAEKVRGYCEYIWQE